MVALEGRVVALFGRFRVAPRDRVAEAVRAAGGVLSRDFTRRSDLFVVGLGAGVFAASGALGARLSAARRRGAPVYGEERLLDLLQGEATSAATLPLRSALQGADLDADALAMLAAFDVVRLDGDLCRFEDAKPLREAAALIADGMAPFDAAQSLRAARAAPLGRRRLVPLGGAAALAWEDDDSLTALDGQHLLPLDLGETTDDLFDAALLAEEEGDAAEAERLYDLAARADRRDAIAPYNLANLQAARGDAASAILNYRTALRRDASFEEAYYNLAGALEATEAYADAEEALRAALRLAPDYADAMFNLAQLLMRRGADAEARALFEAYVAAPTPEEWRAKARRALVLLGQGRAAGPG